MTIEDFYWYYKDWESFLPPYEGEGEGENAE